MDQDYWTRFRNGEESVFNDIYNRYAQMLYAYGMKIACDDSLVRECVQTLFVHPYDWRKNILMPKDLKCYLIASMRNLLYRTRKKRGPVFISLDSMQVTDKGLFELTIDGHETERRGLGEEQIEALQKALNSLTPRQREVIYLRYFKNMSISEVSEIVNINNQSVRDVSYHGLERLRKNGELVKTLLFTLHFALFLL